METFFFYFYTFLKNIKIKKINVTIFNLSVSNCFVLCKKSNLNHQFPFVIVHFQTVTPEIFNVTPVIFIVTPEIFIVTPEIFNVTPEIFIVTPEIFIVTTEK